jgi:hypothetical protein
MVKGLGGGGGGRGGNTMVSSSSAVCLPPVRAHSAKDGRGSGSGGGGVRESCGDLLDSGRSQSSSALFSACSSIKDGFTVRTGGFE